MAAELERVDVVEGQVPLPGMPEDGVLFHVEPTVDPYARLSPDQRRTARQRQQIERGIHPLAGHRTRPDLGTCVHRIHRIHRGGGNRSWPKCDLGPITSGAATDVRRWWPACDRYEARP